MAQNKSADSSFRDLVARLNAMNNVTPEEEKGSTDGSGWQGSKSVG